MTAADHGGAGVPVGIAAPVAPAVSTVVLVLTDVDGSTRSWAEHPAGMDAAMGRHHQIVHAAVTAHGGWRPVDQGEGDAVFAVFDSAAAAVAAVVELQQELAGERWPPGIDLRVRVGIHAGEVIVRGGNVFGSTVNRCARLRGLGAGGQVLLSAPAYELVRDSLPAGVTVLDLGEHRMTDLTRAESVYQLVVPGLPATFPALASLDRARHNLPVQTSSFVGRTREIADLVELVRHERLVTVVGFGGMGKTRLALQVAAELATGDGDGVWFVDLSAVTDPAQVAAAVATTLGVVETSQGLLAAVVAAVSRQRVLLVLDNMEQLLPDAALVVDRIVRAGPGVRVLATSREPLHLSGEYQFALSALPVPPLPRPGKAVTEADVGSLATYDAVRLFTRRASAVRRGFVLTAGNAAAIAAICGRLDGMPLALELAAARTRSMSPEALLPRLDHALTVLTGGCQDLPSRQQTVRATIAWSYDALTRDEQQLLDRLSVFRGTFTLDAAEAICGPALSEGQDDLDVSEGLGVLVDRSLVQTRPATAEQVEDRYDLLVSIRYYAAERLHSAGHAVTVDGRHAAYYLAVTTYPAVSTWGDLERVDRFRRDELHHLRAALAHLNLLGTPADEQLLAAHASVALDAEGLQTDADTVTARALSRSPAASNGRVLLLANRAVAAFLMFRYDDARSDSEAAVDEARQVGDPALLVYALGALLPTARTAAAYQDSVSEAEHLLTARQPTGLGLPWWLVQYRWDGAVGISPLTTAPVAEEVLRRQLRVTPEADRLTVSRDLTVQLFRQGRWEEASALTEHWRTSLSLAQTSPTNSFIGAANASELEMALGNLEHATRDVDLLDRLARIHEVPSWAAEVELRRAALDRLTGRPRDGLDRLAGFVADTSTSTIDRAQAHRFLAVLHREVGDLDAAAQHLDRAWRFVTEQGAPAVDVAISCLLERATQLSGSNPAEAVRLIGVVHARRPAYRFGDFGVVYKTKTMLDVLGSVLGGPTVDAILIEGLTQPLPDPA